MNMPKQLMSQFATLALGFAATSAWAAANTWTGGDGNWSDASNWKNAFSANNNVSEDNNAYFPAAAAGKTVTFTDAFNWGNYGVWYQIQLKNGLGNPVVFTADTAAHGFTSNSGSSYQHLAVGTKGDAGSLKITEGTYTFNGSATVSANDNGGADGELEMTGGTLTAPRIFVGGVGGYKGTLTMSGGTVRSTSDFFLADSTSEGTVTVSGGTITAENGLNVAQGGGAKGTLNVAGGTVNVTGGDLTMSPNGADTATLNVTAGTLNVVNSMKIGGKKYTNAGDFVGTITGAVSGGTVTVGNEISVGHAEYNTASFTVSGGEVSCKSLVLGNTQGSTGYMTVDGVGAVSVSEKATVGNKAGTKGYLTVKGGIVETSGYILGADNAATGTVEVVGGKLIAGKGNDNAYFNIPADGATSTAATPIVGNLIVGGTGEVETRLLHVGSLANAEGYLTVTGGSVNVTKYLRVGGKYQGGAIDSTAKGTYLQTAGEVTAVAIEIGSGGATGVMTLEGGTLTVPALVKGTGSGTVNFNGGTLKASAASGDFISSGLACDVQAGGLVIDTDYAVTVQNALTGVGTITKRGTGTLTFTVNPTCAVKIEEGNVVFAAGTMSGKVTVGADAIYQYDSALAYSGGIEIEEGGYLAYAASESGTIAAAVTGATEDNVLVVTGTSEKTGTASVSGTTVTITVSETAATETTWVGASGADWNIAANWTHGVPTSSITANFIADAVVAMSTDGSAGRLCLNGHALTFGAASGDTRRGLSIGSFDTENGGTLVLKTAKITGAGGTSSDMKPLVIPANVAIRVEAESELNDNWGTISVLGKVTLNADLRLYYYVDLFGGVEGTGSLVSSEAAAQIRTEDEVMGSRLTGSRYFGGDWSDWSGSFTRNGDTDERIVFINDLEATNAVFNLYGDVTLGTNTAATGELVFKFGTLNMTGNLRRIEYSSEQASYVVQVAAGKFDSKKYFNNGNTATKVVDGTLRKVGTGVFTYTGFGFNIIDVQGGEFMFVDGPFTGSDSKFGERYTTIDTLAVAAGATLSGTNYVNIAISSLTLADGAFVAGPGTKLTNVGSATLQGTGGVKVLATDTAALTAGSTYNLIKTTGGISGAPYWAAVDAMDADIPASSGKAKNWWLAKVRSGKNLVLKEGNPNAGFAIIVK